jgi:hypothetical protein
MVHFDGLYYTNISQYMALDIIRIYHSTWHFILYEYIIIHGTLYYTNISQYKALYIIRIYHNTWHFILYEYITIHGTIYYTNISQYMALYIIRIYHNTWHEKRKIFRSLSRNLFSFNLFLRHLLRTIFT